MANDRTTITELVTGLGMLGFTHPGMALAARPPEMASVSPEGWDHLDELYHGGVYDADFGAAWENGMAFFDADFGLRRRRPLLVEWRGGTRQPGDEPVPADLRVDHVFLVSCKYLSKIVTNTSPAGLFDRLLAGGHVGAGGGRSADWYAEVAGDAYQELYRQVVEVYGLTGVPARAAALGAADRRRVKQAMGRGAWPPVLRPLAADFSAAVAAASADRWRAALAGADRERVLWRLLRIGSAPYFVLGAAQDNPVRLLRLRIGTAWDWRQKFRLTGFDVQPQSGGQPVVRWQAEVTPRRSRAMMVVEGHVEVRWSHGKFAQPPEAKVYLDTPHHQVPGYWPLT